jgi:hypothetical protein
MNLSNFRVVQMHNFVGELIGYKVFSNAKAAEKFRKLYNEKYRDYCACIKPLTVYYTVEEQPKYEFNMKMLFMSDV